MNSIRFEFTGSFLPITNVTIRATLRNFEGRMTLALASRGSLVVAAFLTALSAGCTRKFFRNCADDDVTGVLTQKNVFPDWKIENWHVYPDPRARFADLSNPDRPPYPPDDYAAYRLSPNPQSPKKKWGVGRVDGEGYLTIMQQWDCENRQLAALPSQRKPDTPPAAAPSPPGERLPAPQPVPEPAEARDARMPRDARIPSVQPEVILVGGIQLQTIDVASSFLKATYNEHSLAMAASVERIVPRGASRFRSKAHFSPPKEDQNTHTTISPVRARGQTADPPPVEVAAIPEDYLRALKVNEEGYRLTLDQCVELGIFNSREFQDQREALYNAALPVTLERFRFAAQAFFAESLIRQSIGAEASGGPSDSWILGTDASISKLFPTGANLLVSLANRFVIDLTNGAPYAAVSNLSLTLSQPLLRGGGFAVTLEPLTQAERTLLYAIRSYARYRKLFYVAIAGGGSYTNNPYGLAGLSVNLGRGIGGNLTAPSIGYLPTILSGAIVANQKRNIEALQQLLKLYQAFREGGQQSDIQVGQVEQNLLDSQIRLLGSSNVQLGGGGGGPGIRGYLDNLDSFKLQLGVPLTVGLDLDTSPLRPIREQLARFEAVYADLQEVENEARRIDPQEPIARFRPRWRTLLIGSKLSRGTPFAETIRERWNQWESLSDEQIHARVSRLADERRRLLDRKTERDLKGQPEPAEEAERILAITAELDLAAFERALRAYEAQPWLNEKEPLRSTLQASLYRDVFNAFYQLILEVRNNRLAQIRTQWPKLPPVLLDDVDLIAAPLDDAYTLGIQTALTRRLDLMNTRAQVVDAWRQVAVRANDLQGVLDVRYDLFSNTPDAGGNPFAFSTARSQQLLSINAELPLVRRAERNAYRVALINYQSARRRLMAFEDNIANDVRADLRELRVIAEQYRLQQRLVELGYSQVDNAQAILIAPPVPGAQTDAGSAAALTQQVLQAQTRLLAAQNDLYTLWVNYIVSRMQFYLDTEAMELDSRGLWLDEFSSANVSPSISPTNDNRRGNLPPNGGNQPQPERLPPPRP